MIKIEKGEILVLKHTKTRFPITIQPRAILYAIFFLLILLYLFLTSPTWTVNAVIYKSEDVGLPFPSLANKSFRQTRLVLAHTGIVRG